MILFILSLLLIIILIQLLLWFQLKSIELDIESVHKRVNAIYLGRK